MTRSRDTGSNALCNTKKLARSHCDTCCFVCCLFCAVWMDSSVATMFFSHPNLLRYSGGVQCGWDFTLNQRTSFSVGAATTGKAAGKSGASGSGTRSSPRAQPVAPGPSSSTRGSAASPRAKHTGSAGESASTPARYVTYCFQHFSRATGLFAAIWSHVAIVAVVDIVITPPAAQIA